MWCKGSDLGIIAKGTRYGPGFALRSDRLNLENIASHTNRFGGWVDSIGGLH